MGAIVDAVKSGESDFRDGLELSSAWTGEDARLSKSNAWGEYDNL